MLKLEDIRYPITFKSYGNGFVTFTDEDNGTWDSGYKCEQNVSEWVVKHNKFNHVDGDYSYEMEPVSEPKWVSILTMEQAQAYEHSCLDNLIQSGVIIPDHRVSKAAHDVFEEMNSQDRKWGANRDHSPALWQLILGEEVGEVCQAMLHDEFGGDHAGTVRAELVQVAAVAMQMIEFYDRQAK